MEQIQAPDVTSSEAKKSQTVCVASSAWEGVPCSGFSLFGADPGHGWSAPAITMYRITAPSRQPLHSLVVSGPSVLTVGGCEQAIPSAQRCSVVAIDVNGTPAIERGPCPPSIGWFWSASPWIASNDTPRDGLQDGTSSEPATGAIAFTRSARSQPKRSAMIAPFECPVMNTRPGSTGSRFSRSPISAARKPTSSTFVRDANPQQPPPFHVFRKPSGNTATKCSASAVFSNCELDANWSPEPSPPCSPTTMGHPAAGGVPDGMNSRYVRSSPPKASFPCETPATGSDDGLALVVADAASVGAAVVSGVPAAAVVVSPAEVAPPAVGLPPLSCLPAAGENNGKGDDDENDDYDSHALMIGRTCVKPATGIKVHRVG